MISKEEQIDSTKLMAENERAVKRLYLVFAQKNAEHSNFWLQLAEEEGGHAEMLDGFCKKIEKDEVSLKRKICEPEEIKNLIGECEEVIERAKNNAISYSIYAEQLSAAVELEKGMVEKKFFKAFDTDDRSLKDVLKRLKKDTEDHRKRLEKEEKEEKKR